MTYISMASLGAVGTDSVLLMLVLQSNRMERPAQCCLCFSRTLLHATLADLLFPSLLFFPSM